MIYMYDEKKILVIIPARGGSKGIPKKNLRLLCGNPLISYVIKVARNSKYVDDVIISTDDENIKFVSEKFGAETLMRTAELSNDDVPLDPVIYDALIRKEKKESITYDIVITIQPTSPLLKSATLDKAIEKFSDEKIDSVISVVDDRHLSWGFNEKKGVYYPLYEKRLNRQYLPKKFRETGSILATKHDCITENSRLGKNIDLIEVSAEESTDIDNYSDWWLAENYMNKKRIAIIVNANEKIGTGHIYRCLSIASKLLFHDVFFILNQTHKLGIDIVKNNHYPYKIYSDEGDFYSILDEYSPNIVINDVLDTSDSYIKKLKDKNYFVVNFEDLGTGIKEADLVFNALYEYETEEDNVYMGHEYYILKDEFFLETPKLIENNVKNVLITFGGTDSNNFTEKIIKALLKTEYSQKITIILGIGYPKKQELIDKYKNMKNIEIFKNVDNISQYMVNADIIFTSAGRTMYEICSLGIPTICLCQNKREQTHVFANEKNGFINMGLGIEVNENEIIEQFNELLHNYELRKNMNNKMLSIDLKHGFDNIWSIIKTNYQKK